MPDVMQAEVGRWLYHFHREKRVEHAIKQVQQNLGPAWRSLKVEEIQILGHVLQCTWNTIDQKQWDTIPFGSMTMNRSFPRAMGSVRATTRHRSRSRRSGRSCCRSKNDPHLFISSRIPVSTMPPANKTTTCPGCGLVLADLQLDPPDRFNASGECWQLFSDLSCYTVALRDTEFIHQHAVDAYEAQHAGGTTRNITVAFGLIGLYLALEKGYTGKQVQQVHMRIAKSRREWPWLEPPARPARLTVLDVLNMPDGPRKDAMIRKWMEAVWESWVDHKRWVREMTDILLVGGRG